MPRFEASHVGCDHLAGRHDHDSIDVALDRHHLVREGPRNAVPVAIKGDGLILVHRGGGANHTGVEPMVGKRRRGGFFFGETRRRS